VYEEDVIRSKDKKKIGIVIRTAHDDDDSESSDSETEDEDEKLEPGKVMVGWYSMNTKWNDETEVKVVDEKSIELVDRSLLHGDVVRWSDKSKGKQKGQIQDVDIYVDLKVVGTNHVLKNISSKKLMPLEKFVAYLIVVKGPWMGDIRDVTLSLTLVLKNGTKCIISGSAVNSLEDTTDQRDDESTFYSSDFYPGQQVRGPANVFKEAKWIVGSRPAISNHGRIKAVIEEVSVEKIEVFWQVCGFIGDVNASVEQPPRVIKKSELHEVKVLNHFKEAHIQIGDKAYYNLTEDDVNFCKGNNAKQNKKSKEKDEDKKSSASSVDQEMELQLSEDEEEEEDSDYDTEPTPVRTGGTPLGGAGNRRGGSRPRRRRHAQVQKRKKRYQPPVNLKEGEKVAVEVCHTKTLASTLWQDGTSIDNVTSIDLHPVIHLDELEVFPGDFVIDKRDTASKTQERFGVIQSSDFDARLCNIRWLSFINDNTEAVSELEDDVSVYDITDHKDYAFRTGDIVVSLAGKADVTKDPTKIDGPAGEVLKVNLNGTVQVLWVDGSTTSILPSRLFVMAKDDMDSNYDDDGSIDGFSSNEDDVEWETASDASDIIMSPADLQAQLNPLEDVIMRSLAAITPRNNDENNTDTTPSVIARDQRTVNYINALETNFAVRSKETTEIESETKADQSETSTTDSSQSKTNENDVDQSKAAASEMDQSECVEIPPTEPECIVIQPVSNHVSFKMLESAPSCHHFVSTPHTPTNMRLYNSTLMKELKLLKTHLPPGITVKCFEDRSDLFSVLIHGPPSTPYQDGLFYFDIQLPEGYPGSPPKVHYYSYCTARLNPNLYEEGKVCVSLLGTWSGKGNETWTSKSTLHQVLLSIQGLILNEEPYYNEAGYEKQRGSVEGLENSRLYNEMASIKMLQSIQNMLSRPPEIFKDEAMKHFKENLPRVIERYNSWLEITETGHKDIPTYPLFPLSKGFRATVIRVLESLNKKLEKLQSDL